MPRKRKSTAGYSSAHKPKQPPEKPLGKLLHFPKGIGDAAPCVFCSNVVEAGKSVCASHAKMEDEYHD